MAERKKRKRSIPKQEIYKEAIAIVRGEKQRWEVATAFVTDRVSFKMRQLIRICRKNYYGIFDQPTDQFTGLEKVWYPLTEINVEAVVKNIDLDQKDINFRSKNPNGYAITDLTRAHVKDKLSRMYFGQMLDDAERQLAIDGTIVWKTWKEYGKMQTRPVDLLNIYIDPTTPSIQHAYRFTERNLMFPEEMLGMTGWFSDQLKGIDENVPEGLPQTDPYWMNRATQVNSNVKLWDVYETWGKIPLHLLTGDRNDMGQEVEGHLVVAGIDSPGKERCLLIERNEEKLRNGDYKKPYEEAWFTRVPNRWYGRGVAEKLLTLQIYANIVFNVRINRSRISQMGLFKIRKGAGITPQMLTRLPSNGAIVLNNMEDLEQMVIQEVGATSYKDEDVINALSERLTNAFEVVTGEALPSSTPATNAAIQNANAKSGFSIIKDGVAQFLQRWMDRHALPILAHELKAEEIVRIMGTEENFGALVDRVLMFKVNESLQSHWEKGYLPDPQEFQMAVDSAREKMMRGDMFVKLVQDIVTEELDTEVFVTNEETDVPTTVSNLISLLQAAPEYRDDIIKQTFDLLGLGQPRQNQKPIGAPLTQPGQMQPGQPGAGATPSPISPAGGNGAPAFGRQPMFGMPSTVGAKIPAVPNV